MQEILQAINSLGYTALTQSGDVIVVESGSQLSAINPSNFMLEVKDGGSLNLVTLHGDDKDATIVIRLGRGATLHLTQLLVGTGKISVDIINKEAATSKVISASLKSNNAALNIQLCGVNISSEVYTLQMGAGDDNNLLKINMKHMSPDCMSHSLSKCVASGDSNLHFDGLVYVAHDAQRTEAVQNCRSVELSESSHIIAQPQLEIYADDVKCSHGATMGQVDSDAILYMRQRGLSEAQARRVQMEGFITDIISKCNIPEVCDTLKEIAVQKLEQM